MQKTTIIYNSLLVAIIAIVVALPLIKVPITVSARGSVRPAQEDNKILSLVSGRVIQSNLIRTNQSVNKGDTLLVITSNVQAKMNQAEFDLPFKTKVIEFYLTKPQQNSEPLN